MGLNRFFLGAVFLRVKRKKKNLIFFRRNCKFLYSVSISRKTNTSANAIAEV